MKVGVIGSGYVGLVAAACFAEAATAFSSATRGALVEGGGAARVFDDNF